MEIILNYYNDSVCREHIKSNIKMLEIFSDEKCDYAKNDLGSRSAKNDYIIKKIEAVAKKNGMEDLVEITGIDEVNIPAFSVAHQFKYDDIISFNSGKGVTKEQARMSALMEFVERRSAVMHSATNINMSYNNFPDNVKASIVRPSSLVTYYTDFVADSMELNWSPVVNIINGSMALCPTIAVLFRYCDKEAIFANNSNGLSSGITYHEAIVQGIYEVIERDSVSIAFAGGEIEDVEIESITSECCMKLIEEFESNGIKICIKYVKNDFGIPCFMVSGNDTKRKSPLLLSGGFGCHAKKEVALTRALTELAQTRKVIIEAKREDVASMRPGGDTEKEYERILETHKKWYYGQDEIINYEDIGEHTFHDLTEELKWLVDSIKEKGYDIYVANLSIMDEEYVVPVVRVIIPGFENWYHDKKRVGIRLYNKALSKQLSYA